MILLRKKKGTNNKTKLYDRSDSDSKFFNDFFCPEWILVEWDNTHISAKCFLLSLQCQNNPLWPSIYADAVRFYLCSCAFYWSEKKKSVYLFFLNLVNLVFNKWATILIYHGKKVSDTWHNQIAEIPCISSSLTIFHFHAC
jgi:hypothetical protein